MTVPPASGASPASTQPSDPAVEAGRVAHPARPLPTLSDNEHLLPPHAFITPSNIDPWRGARRPDQLFTGLQLAALINGRLDPATIDYVVVRSPATQRDMYWYRWGPTPVYLCPCPILGRRSDGEQLQVISPAGFRKWVYSDGSITRAGWALKNNPKGGRRK